MEVNRLVAELKLLPPVTDDLPVPPVPGVEPLLTLADLCAWTGYSLTHINNCRRRARNPLPVLGTEKAPRFLPSEVLAWMRREYASASESQ